MEREQRSCEFWSACSWIGETLRWEVEGVRELSTNMPPLSMSNRDQTENMGKGMYKASCLSIPDHS